MTTGPGRGGSASTSRTPDHPHTFSNEGEKS